jgi:hypothetical protein
MAGSVNGIRRPPRPRIEIAGAASESEAAAIAVALQNFLAETAPAPAAVPQSAWQRTALREGVEHSPR